MRMSPSEWKILLQRVRDNQPPHPDPHDPSALLLAHEKLEPNQLAELLEALKDNSTITWLDFGNNNFTDNEIKQLSIILKINRKISSLTLNNNYIGDKGIKDLSIALKENSTLRRLELARNKIGYKGAKYLSNMLKENFTITSIELDDNEIGDKGVKYLSDMLRINRTLTSLSLQRTHFGIEGGKCLIAALENNNYALIYLTVIGTPLLPRVPFERDNGHKKIDAFIKRNTELSKQCIKAVIANQHDEAKALLDQGVSLLTVKGGNTLLHLAVQYGHEKLVEYLIQRFQEQGIPIAQLNYKKQSALDLAKDNPTIQALFGVKKEKVIAQTNSTEKNLAEQLPSIGQLTISFTIPYADFIFEQELGRGSFGIVYKGTYHYNTVAIKQLHNTQFSNTATKEFRQEMEVMAQLRSPHIVQLYGICQETGHYSIVMEYMPKGSLFSVLHSQESLSWFQRESIALDVAKGLAYLHYGLPNCQILHRDLKSLNVLLDNQYHAKLTDFGLAKVKQEVTSTSSMSSGKAVGTLAWMAPELFDDKPNYTLKSDMYSYGMVLWELAAREVPFKDIANPGLIAARVCMGKREEVPQDTSPKLAKLIRFCWAQESQKRPNISEVISALQATDDDNFAIANSVASGLTDQNNISSNNNNNNNNSEPRYLSNNHSLSLNKP